MTEFSQQGQRPVDERVVEAHEDALSGLRKYEKPFFTNVSGVPEQQSLYAQLHPLGFPGPLRIVGGGAALALDRSYNAGITFKQVNLRHQRPRKG